jgi:acetyl-CoA carboxylase biotin carboxylase subunit
VKLARAGKYTNAGTVEFLVDADRNFYFLEMNTRLQVEHPVTEIVTSLDIVKLQIRIAAGETLPFTQKDVTLRGHAIECRIYAEDPDNNFFPSPGKITNYATPSGPGIRLDDGVYEGWTVPNEYDPMLGKLIAWGSDRAEAMGRMRRALREYQAGGIKTNVRLFERILANRDFINGSVYTRWLDDFLAHAGTALQLTTVGTAADLARDNAAAIAIAMWHSRSSARQPSVASDETTQPVSRWKLESRLDQLGGIGRG